VPKKEFECCSTFYGDRSEWKFQPVKALPA